MTDRSPGGSRELLNYPSISYTTVRGWPVLGIGLAMLALCAVGIQVWRGKMSGAAQAPLWVIGLSGVVFGIGGVLLVLYGVRDLRADARRRRAMLTHPNEPWRGDFDWSSATTTRG